MRTEVWTGPPTHGLEQQTAMGLDCSEQEGEVPLDPGRHRGAVLLQSAVLLSMS